MDDLLENKNVTELSYKSRDGSIKEVRIIQPLNPDQRKLNYADIQLLGREIAKVLREDAF